MGFEFELDLIYYVVLFFMAILAGFFDTIVGGGGFITLTSLLASGIPAHLAIATNKLQSVFGSGTATLAYIGKRSLPHIAWGVFFTALGSILGALAVLLVQDKHLRLIILVLLSLTLFFSLILKNFGHSSKEAKMKNIRLFHFIFGLVLGFYDGFLGPGTGSFWIFVLVFMLGFDIKNASINSKILNFSSNVGSLFVFLFFYKLLWVVGLLMGLGQILGAFLGAKFVLKSNVKIIRLIFLFIVCATLIKVAYDYANS